MTLIQIQPIVDIIGLTLQTSFIENELNGVSLIFIAKPETAKTSSIFKFQNLDFVSYYDEITQKKLIDEFLPLIKVEQKKTLLIPDLINCIEKQKSTRDQFLWIIKSGIDDTGIVQISTPHKQLSFLKLIEGLKFNMITAITTPNFKKIKKLLADTGLLSRFIPFTYDYPINILKDIFGYIEGERTVKEIVIPEVIQKKVSVPDNPKLFKEFELISSTLGIQSGSYGLRCQLNLQRLAKGNALQNERDFVTKEDIDRTIQLSKWINFDFNPL